MSDNMDLLDEVLDQCEYCTGCANCDVNYWPKGGPLKRRDCKIKNLKTSHLINILNMIGRKRWKVKFGKERMKLLTDEAAKRGVTQGADKRWREPHGFEKIA